jgi:hypothetical protein
MRVTLVRRFGDHQPGATVDVDDTTGHWLVGLNYGTADGLREPKQNAAAPGTHGPDPLAGGDPTRLYGHAAPSVERRPNHALPVPGSPVQYNRGVAPGEPTNLSGRHNAKQAAQDAARASQPAGVRASNEAPASDSPSPDEDDNDKRPAASGKPRAANTRKTKD